MFIYNGSIDTEWEEFDGFDRYLICIWDGEICIKNKKTHKRIQGHFNESAHTTSFSLIDNNNKHRKLTDSTIYNMHFKPKLLNN